MIFYGGGLLAIWRKICYSMFKEQLSREENPS